MKVLLGDKAESFLKELEIENYINKNPDIRGGVFQEGDIYIGYDCRVAMSEVFVEDFDDVVEAAKYANGVMARTINNNYI